MVLKEQCSQSMVYGAQYTVFKEPSALMVEREHYAKVGFLDCNQVDRRDIFQVLMADRGHCAQDCK